MGGGGGGVRPTPPSQAPPPHHLHSLLLTFSPPPHPPPPTPPHAVVPVRCGGPVCGGKGRELGRNRSRLFSHCNALPPITSTAGEPPGSFFPSSAVYACVCARARVCVRWNSGGASLTYFTAFSSHSLSPSHKSVPPAWLLSSTKAREEKTDSNSNARWCIYHSRCRCSLWGRRDGLNRPAGTLRVSVSVCVCGGGGGTEGALSRWTEQLNRSWGCHAGLSD